jgi:hypothetical protein
MKGYKIFPPLPPNRQAFHSKILFTLLEFLHQKKETNINQVSYPQLYLYVFSNGIVTSNSFTYTYSLRVFKLIEMILYVDRDCSKFYKMGPD